MPNHQQHFDLIIIGGGMAGVATAYHLIVKSSARFNGSICLLEARNRLGGRIHAVELPSKTVEYGASWIHGIIGNPICDLAVKYKLVDPLGHEATHQMQGVQGKRFIVQGIREDGKKVDMKLLEETFDTYYWFTKQIDSYYAIAEAEGKEPPLEFQNSCGKHLIRDVEKYLEAKDPNDWIQVRKAIFKNLLNLEAVITGSHTMNDVSLRDFGAFEDFPGGNLTIDSGYISIINILLDEIDAKLAELRESPDLGRSQNSTVLFDCQLNQEVVKIKWRNVQSKSPSTQSSSPSGENLCEITCSDGSRYTCHHAVITLPLGVLKETSELMFEPQLPEYKIQSIQKLAFGTVDKIFLEFKNKLSPKFLDPSVNQFILIWADDEDSAGDASISNNNNNDSKKTNLKITLKTDSPKNWYRTLYSLVKVSDYALSGWLSGEDAEFVEQMDPSQIAKIMTDEVLRKFFHPEFPEPEAVFVTKWKQERFSRGSYTYISSTSSVRDIEKLSQPIYSDPGQEKPVLLFAGEACHPTYFSTTHGAFLSGKKAASYLVDPETTDQASSNAGNSK